MRLRGSYATPRSWDLWDQLLFPEIFNRSTVYSICSETFWECRVSVALQQSICRVLQIWTQTSFRGTENWKLRVLDYLNLVLGPRRSAISKDTWSHGVNWFAAISAMLSDRRSPARQMHVDNLHRLDGGDQEGGLRLDSKHTGSSRCTMMSMCAMQHMNTCWKNRARKSWKKVFALQYFENESFANSAFATTWKHETQMRSTHKIIVMLSSFVLIALWRVRSVSWWQLDVIRIDCGQLYRQEKGFVVEIRQQLPCHEEGFRQELAGVQFLDECTQAFSEQIIWAGPNTFNLSYFLISYCPES